jgi:hypothetical protein
MYEEWRAAPVQVDLPRLWRELGVEQHGRRTMLRDDAPLAEIRRAITARIPAAHLQAAQAIDGPADAKKAE